MLHVCHTCHAAALYEHVSDSDPVISLPSVNMERQLGSLILATDISRQNEYLSRFRTHLDQEELCLGNASHRHFILQVSKKTHLLKKKNKKERERQQYCNSITAKMI